MTHEASDCSFAFYILFINSSNMYSINNSSKNIGNRVCIHNVKNVPHSSYFHHRVVMFFNTGSNMDIKQYLVPVVCIVYTVTHLASATSEPGMSWPLLILRTSLSFIVLYLVLWSIWSNKNIELMLMLVWVILRHAIINHILVNDWWKTVYSICLFIIDYYLQSQSVQRRMTY